MGVVTTYKCDMDNCWEGTAKQVLEPNSRNNHLFGFTIRPLIFNKLNYNDMDWSSSITNNLWPDNIQNRQSKEKVAEQIAEKVKDGETT